MPPLPPSRRPTARLRRRLWRLRHALLLAALAASTWAVVGELRPAPAPTLDVLVLTRDVAAGAVLGEEDVRTVPLPRDLVSPGMLRAPPQVAGERVAVALPAGFPLAAQVLVGPGLADGVDAGEVVVPVRVADAAAARSLRPGDRVDLLAATADAASSEGAARVVAAGALVLARDDGAGGGLLGGQEEAPLLFVALPRGDAPAVVGASAWAPLRVVLPG